MTEASLEAPMAIEHPRIASLRALAATHIGELARAAELLRATDLSHLPARQEGMVVASTAEWLAAVSGERHVVDVYRSPTRDDHLYSGIWREIFDLYELRCAIRAGDWQEVPRFASLERVSFNDRNKIRVDALLVPGLVAINHREDARHRAEDLVKRAEALGAPVHEVEGLLVLAELDTNEVLAHDALALARRNNLVLAQIDALEMLAITAGSSELAARCKVSAADERERRDYVFRWPSRVDLLDAVDVPDGTDILDLERTVELALGR